MTVKAYVATTGILFALLVLAHVARVVAEGTAMARDPVFVGFTVLALGLAGWAGYAYRRIP